MERIEKSFEIAVPARGAQEQWRRFPHAHEAEARFEPLSENRTRVTLSMNRPQQEEMEKVVEGFKNSLVGESVQAGNPGARGAEPGAAGGTMGGSTGGTPGAGGGKAGSTPGGTPE